jgi:hypothetical protein
VVPAVLVAATPPLRAAPAAARVTGSHRPLHDLLQADLLQAVANDGTNTDGVVVRQARGLLGDLGGQVLDHFPEHAVLLTPERRGLTVRHLLDMATGWRWDESSDSCADPRNSETRMSLSLDPLRHMLESPFVAAPGAAWEYFGGATLVLADILERLA